MKKKISTYIILLGILLPILVLADDGRLKLDTDIITNSGKETFTNRIEAKYAPNLFLNRTQKVVEEKTLTTKELLEDAEQTVFKNEKSYSMYQLQTQVIQASLFQQYTIEENFSTSRGVNSGFRKTFSHILTGLFLLIMVLVGVFLGRKWHELRKNKADSRV